MTDKNIENNSSKPLLTPTEERFFITLTSIIKNSFNDKYLISCMTKLSAIVNIEKNDPIWKEKSEYETYTKQEVDFTIHDKEIPSIVKLAIEHDDKSHNKEYAIKKDKIKNKALNKAKIPILRFNYSDDIKTIKENIEKELNSSNQTKEKVITKNDVYIDDSQIKDSEQNNNISIWNKFKKPAREFLIEKVIPTIIGLVGFIIIATVILKGFQNWANGIQQKMITPKKPINITPSPIPTAPAPYENKILIPAQPQIPKENIIIESPKIKVKVRIAGKYISNDKSYVMYERTDTRKQRNVTIEDFLKMCECNATELYTGKLMDIVEYS